MFFLFKHVHPVPTFQFVAASIIYVFKMLSRRLRKCNFSSCKRYCINREYIIFGVVAGLKSQLLVQSKLLCRWKISILWYRISFINNLPCFYYLNLKKIVLSANFLSCRLFAATKKTPQDFIQ